MSAEKRDVTIEELARALQTTSEALVVSHYNPDIDAYGSSCGLTLALRQAGARVVCCNESGVLRRYEFFPGVREVTKSLPQLLPDTVFVVDCGDLKRTGDSFVTSLMGARTLYNIDHHATNDRFGTLNYVCDAASSTSEIIADVLEVARFPLSADVATCLYGGIVGDTGSFRYASTTDKTFRIARDLVLAGANPAQVAMELFSRDSRAAVKLQAEAMLRAEFFAGGRVALTVLDEACFTKHGAAAEDSDSIVERLRDIDGVIVSALIRFHDGIWRISLRSKSAQCNVATVCERFGGGGHKAAAAFRWRRSVEELRALLLPALESVVA